MPIIRRKYRTYATPGICHSIYMTVRYTGPCIPDGHQYGVRNTGCHIRTVFLLMMGTYLPKTCREKH